MTGLLCIFPHFCFPCSTIIFFLSLEGAGLCFTSELLHLLLCLHGLFFPCAACIDFLSFRCQFRMTTPQIGLLFQDSLTQLKLPRKRNLRQGLCTKLCLLGTLPGQWGYEKRERRMGSNAKWSITMLPLLYDKPWRGIAGSQGTGCMDKHLLLLGIEWGLTIWAFVYQHLGLVILRQWKWYRFDHQAYWKLGCSDEFLV